MTRSARERTIAVVADVVAVLVFVAAGRDAHADDGGLGGVATIAAPFLIGLALAWAASPRLHRRPASVRAGVDVWLSTVVFGLLLRRLVWDRSTALTFVIVTTIVLGALIVGWRLAWTKIRSFTRRRREIRSALPPSKAGR